MDGARFAHACTSLGCSPADISWRAGVDVLCFGGTKNGMAVGEAVILFDPELAVDFAVVASRQGSLLRRCVFSAPCLGLIDSGAWLHNAEHANACAQRLAELVCGAPGISLIFPVQANAVFVKIPEGVMQALRALGWRFYTFIGGGARFMFAWDTDLERVEKLAQDILCCVEKNLQDEEASEACEAL